MNGVSTSQTRHALEPASALTELQRLVDRVGVFPARVRVRVKGLDVFRWLAGLGDSAGYWSDREGRGFVAWAGEAAGFTLTEFSGISAVRNRLGTGMRAFGGFRFTGGGRFVVPLMEFDGEWLSANVLQAGVTLPVVPLRAPGRLPLVIDRRDAPDKNDWSRNVMEALDLIEYEVIDKLVLARRSTLDCAAPVPPVALLQSLLNGTHDCFGFLLPLGDGRFFVGATPERLFQRRGDHLRSDVLAGTRPRGATAAEDKRLGRELLDSAKDQLEHDIVRKSIRQGLHRVCQSLHVDDTARLLLLAKKQHLYSQVEARLAPSVGDDELLARLHPTPAVGGYPRENALAEIQRLEPFEREWYAAPIGWIDCDGCEFAVGIRSGLIDGNSLSLYSGAGIVPGSRASVEWEEIENKIVDFLDRMQA